ncbi:MAG: ABC transporter ATP-binding protein [Clostridia bacterium]|nr:ABC transporter ATP-binding protein [Clostridia bacterium]
MLKLLKHLKPYSKLVVGVLILIFLQAFAELYLPTLMADIVDVGVVSGDTDYIIRVGGLMLLVAIGGVFCAIIASYLSAITATGFGRDLRSRVFARVESYSLTEFDKIGTASLITRTTNDITQVQQVLLVMLRMMVRAPMMCIGGIIMAVSQDAELSRLLLIALPVTAVAVAIFIRKGMPLFKDMQQKLDKLNLVLREKLTGIRVIRAFNRVEYEKERFNQANLDLTATAIKVNRIMAAMMPLMILIMNFTTIAIVWFGAIRIDSGAMQVGSLMAFIQYAMQIMFSLVMVSMMFVLLPRAEVSAVRINEVLQTRPDIVDPEQPEILYGQKGFLQFKEVSFRYPGAEQAALENISFSAGPGQTTAIIGGTGSGKTTLVSLILRFYDVTSGSILLDGVDIRKMPQEKLRAKIGFVPQKAVLFSGTIRENICYGKENATEAEIRQACEVAQATEFIASRHDGFDAVIAQGGVNVSGGQKQRLAIARALVRRPEIYIFDDSFSALDFKTEARLRRALKKETAGATVIIVAQRVATVMDADQIIVLDNGKIVGKGDHQTLLQTCSVYREIVASQLSEEELA